VIAASCAGVNFLITAFLMLSLGHLWRNRSQSLSWKFVPFAALIAYLVTLLANTVRITTALQLRSMRVESGLLSPGQLHRFEGIFIYFGFLLLLYVISDFLSSGDSGLERKRLAVTPGAPS
jgi:exosortase K